MRTSDFASTAPWRFIFGKPSEFPPELHKHPLSDFLQTGGSNNQTIAWNPYTNTFLPFTQPSGTSGSDGPAGAQGPQGTQGPQGPRGVDGGQGPQGFIGLLGQIGIQGLIGLLGGQGLQGFQGITGNSGPQGSQGFSGPRGVQGNQGHIGDTGPQGDSGPQGEQGPQGVQGPQGYQGDAGNPSSCAYECTGWGEGVDYGIATSPQYEVGMIAGQNYWIDHGCYIQEIPLCPLPGGCP